MRALMVILGVLLLLPGLCFLGFGVLFATNGGGMAGMFGFGAVEVVIGGLITWGAVLLIINYSRPR